MPDATPPNPHQHEAEKAYQANLAAARERLAQVEAALYSAPQNPAPNPTSAPKPEPTPPAPPVTATPASFSLSDLKNPTTPTAAPIETPVPPIDMPPVTAEPTAPAQKPAVPPDVAAIIANHKSVSPLSDVQASAPPAKTAMPPLSASPLASSVHKIEEPDHLKPVKTPPPPASLPSRLKPILSAVIVFFIVLAAFKAPIYYYQVRYLIDTQNKTSQTAQTASTISVVPTLTIPKIGVSAPIIFVPSTDEATVQKGLESGVIHYSNTAKPGQVGNTVIFGHSSNDWDKPGDFKFIFVLLEKLAVNDKFSIDYNGTRYEYQIYNRQVILATDIHVVQPTPDPVATLITCWPTGTSQKRLVVQAKQISPSPSADTKSSAVASNKTNNTVLPGADSNNGIVGTVTTWIENIRSAIRGDVIQVNDQ